MRLSGLLVLSFFCVMILTPGASAVYFSGSGSATFINPLPTEGKTFDGVGSSTFKSGEPIGSTPNILSFDSLPFSSIEGKAFAIAEFDYYNAITVLGSNVKTVDVKMLIALTSHNIFETFSFSFELNVTTNHELSSDADTLQVNDVLQATMIDVNGSLYSLELLGFSNDGGQNFVDTFTVDEEQEVGSFIYARTTAVPEPCTILLLAAGGLIFTRRGFYSKN